MNGATERVHRFLNSAIGIFCENNQENWEDYLQPAVYSHNSSPISGTSDISPFFLVFGRAAPSPETLSFDLPPSKLSVDKYAQHLVSRLKSAHFQFQNIKSDLRRRQRELYDMNSRYLTVPEGKIVYLRNDSPARVTGSASRFLRNFNSPYIVVGHPHNKDNLLFLKDIETGKPFPRPVNIEKIVVIPDSDQYNLRPPEDALADTPQDETITENPEKELTRLAYHFGRYLQLQPSKSSISSEACKYIYQQLPDAREILSRHGKLRGLTNSCPYLS